MGNGPLDHGDLSGPLCVIVVATGVTAWCDRASGDAALDRDRSR